MLNWLKGKKTYITIILGVIVVLDGWLLGGGTIAGVTIPSMTAQDAWKYLWEAGILGFIRNAISGVGVAK